MTEFVLPTSLAEAEALDRQDPLASLRDQFALPDGVIYLDGHSLGPATRSALETATTAASRDWANGLICSWNNAGWIDLPRRAGTKIARLIGAPPNSVLVCDSVSVNLFKLAAAALSLARTRSLHVETGEFPTDQYIASGLGKLANAPVEQIAPGGGPDALAQGGVMIKSVVNYRTAQVADIAAYETAARKFGAVIVWDLSHAAGVLALDLTAHDVRCAAGCTYKYLNGGPGAPGYIFVAPEVADEIASPISGWFGHKAPFDFDSAYEPAEGAARFAAGTPPILSLAVLDSALDAFRGVDMHAIQAKARALTALCDHMGRRLGLNSQAPADFAIRGGHVTLTHEHGYAIIQALIERGVTGDFRSPDAMRFGCAPLYLGFADIWRAMQQLGEVVQTELYRDAKFSRRAAVT